MRKGPGRKLFITVKISYLDVCIVQWIVKVQCTIRIRVLVKCRLSGQSSGDFNLFALLFSDIPTFQRGVCKASEFCTYTSYCVVLYIDIVHPFIKSPQVLHFVFNL